MAPKIKICCIGSIDEARIAVEHGAAALGLVAKMPSGPGPISDNLIFEIAQTVPPPIASFLLTSETDACDIIAHHRRTLTNTIQLVDAVSEEAYKAIRKEIPAVKLVQVIHVMDESAIEDAIRISGYVDALLLDSGNPNAAIKELGGTGRTHNWVLSRKIVEQSKVPVFLAGGINPENVQRAIKEVNPFGIDLCSSVRTNGKLDPAKLGSFFAAAGA
ncbi:MAG: phosphoribosylanthranilate isomerase [Bacteroidota bacterium]